MLVFLGLILTGVDAAEADEELEVSIETVFGQGNTYASLLWATFAVSIGTWVLLRLQYYAGDTIYWLWQRGKRKAADAKPLMRFKGARRADTRTRIHTQRMPRSTARCARPETAGGGCRVRGHVAGGHQAAAGHHARAHPRVGHRRRDADARHGRLHRGGRQ